MAEKYAFLAAGSACEVLRSFSAREWAALPRWPDAPRRLPPSEACVCGQRDAARLLGEDGLAARGLAADHVHLLVPARKGRSSGSAATFHVWSGPVPVGGFVRLGKKLFASAPELVILQACGAVSRLEPLLDDFVAAVDAERETLSLLGLDLTHEVVDNPREWEQIRRLVAAAALACEFSGTYRIGANGARYHMPPLMSVSGLRDAAVAAGPSVASRRGLRVAELALDRSASPMETALALILSLPVEYGGFGLGKPLLNEAISLPRVLSTFKAVAPDLLWPETCVALEYDSDEFHRGDSSSGRDTERWNALTAEGYRVLRATPTSVRSLAGMELLAKQLACALGVAPKEPNDVQRLRRGKLFAELMPKSRG